MAHNLLDGESSPYLLQHKDNPVHWMPWGSDAFDRARTENKPILLSVGYAACHWCHVMAHESFENQAIADVMNAGFVNVKVDREERPDVDMIYQHSLAMLGEQGGWPLTMFLNANGEPFWGGTYFPPESRYGRPGFPDVLDTVSKLYRDSPDRIRANVHAIRQGLDRLSRSNPGAGVTMERVDQAARSLLRHVDHTLGGLQGSPKFPHVPVFELLWRAYLRSGDASFARAVTTTCERMCQGGIYDHLGGGFARYSTDPLWLAPHFEKMLYDNAQLIELLTLVWQRTREPLFETRVRETAEWVLREMIAEGGGFASTLDADSEGEEGRFYVWSETEIDAALGADAQLFKAAYDVSAGGNWERVNILNRLRVPTLGDAADEAKLGELRTQLWRLRERRPRPGWDDKVLADWNGLMIAAMAAAGAAFREETWIDAARNAYQFILGNLSENGRLFHCYRLGRSRHAGMLDDYAAMARAALVLHEIDGGDHYLDQARGWTEMLDTHFWDRDTGGYYMSADDAEDLITRTKTSSDSAVPSGNGLMVGVLGRLFLLTGVADFRRRADRLIASLSGHLDRDAVGFCTLLNGFELVEAGHQIVVVGNRKQPETSAFLEIIRDSAMAARVVSVQRPDRPLPSGHPAHGKGQIAGRVTVYVCAGQTCSAPITDGEALARTLSDRAQAESKAPGPEPHR